MNNRIRQLILLTVLSVLVAIAGCAFLPGGKVVESATVVYTAGSKKHTAAVQVPVAASEVFATIVRLIEDKPDVVIENRNDNAFLIEVTDGGNSFTGQVTKLETDRSLLYVWVDAGNSGLTGRELATDVVELVCNELGVEYELVNY
jgi:hypothetical protein